jgi:hypothetical protein
MYLNILYDQCKVADDQARRITENMQSKLLEEADQ